MVKPAPKLDPRTAKSVETEIQQLLSQYLPASFRDPTTGQAKALTGTNGAIVKIFARLTEILIQRLNQVPDKNFLAFLDLLGASRMPPQPSQVPLTFSLAAGSALDAIVPVGTQVSAPPANGESDPVVFETTRELNVTAVNVTQIWVRDPGRDRFADLSQLTQRETEPLAVFEGKVDIEHILYIGENTVLGYPDLQALTLKFDLQALTSPVGQAIDVRQVVWDIWDGDQGIPILPLNTRVTRANQTKPKIVIDSTNPLVTQSGSLTQSGAIVFGNLPVIPQQTIARTSSRWLRCRLMTRITPSTDAQAGRVRASQLPRINTVTFQATIGKTSYPIAYAFTNQFPIDLSKAFFPLGEKPKFGDSLYLGSRDAFSKPDTDVTLRLDLNDLNALGLALPKALPKEAIKIELTWEIWTSKGWFELGKSTQSGPISPYSPPGVIFQDLTKAFTETGLEKLVRFKVPTDPEPQLTIVNGIESFWVRVRITSGHYGQEGSYVEVPKDDRNPSGFQFTSPTFRPPLISVLNVTYNLVTLDKVPDYLVTYNDFNALKIAVNTTANTSPNTAFAPFVPIADVVPTLHIGFELPPTRQDFPNRMLSLYFKLAELVYQSSGTTSHTAGSIAGAPRLIWQYWNGRSQTWELLQPQDETKGLTRPGLLEFLLPVDGAPRPDFGLSQPYYWLRARWQLGLQQTLPASPQLNRVLLNTVLASQTVTLRDEILGSSSGNAGQLFQTTQIPVLPQPWLDVREGEEPSAEDRKVLDQEEGPRAIAITRDLTGQPQAIWVRWHGVPDFYGSGPRDRHYVVDHLTGTLQFGDGINGKIPPPGIGNLRMTHYQTGGGIRGNCLAGRIVQLKTTIPYIDGVTNPEAATGGAEAETIDSLLNRGPKTIRHGDRAVTLEDYEDLALLASPEVARSRCFPVLDLGQNPWVVQNPVEQPPQAIGAVSVMIVPRSTAPNPMPSLGLINQVQDYLAAHSIPTVTLAVVGPLYLGVNVTAVITPESLEGLQAIEQAIEQTLTQFLHPLTGGPDNIGWAFGREPTRSDFYALLESVPGVDHVNFLGLQVVPETGQSDPRSTQRFLVYSGIHKITFNQP